MLKLDLVQTLAFAGVVLFVGYAVKRLLPVLARYNIPAPVIGGLLVAGTVALLRRYDLTLLQLDTTLQTPLNIAFFTTIGFGASLQLLRIGGPAVMVFLLVSTIGAVAQNLVGAGVAALLGQNPLMGVLAGSVTLTGGPATGLAFAPLFEKAGVSGAATLAVAAAMVGIVSGGLLGGPIGTRLIERRGLRPSVAGSVFVPTDGVSAGDVIVGADAGSASPPPGEDEGGYALLKGIVLILVAMWGGSFISARLEAAGFTLPAYIGAMLAAALMRNLDDFTSLLGIPRGLMDDLGNVALSLFLVLALITLRLWELQALAVPLAVMLLAQVSLVLVLCWSPIYLLMGKDYDAAVISSGFAGFMLGTTANAMANMRALVERYGPAPKAFLVVPMVGAFFIDFTNALIITACLNLWG